MEQDGDELIYAGICSNEMDVLFVASDGMVLRTPISNVSLQSRTAQVSAGVSCLLLWRRKGNWGTFF